MVQQLPCHRLVCGEQEKNSEIGRLCNSKRIQSPLSSYLCNQLP